MPGCDDPVGEQYRLCPRHFDGFVYAIRADEDYRRQRYASERIDVWPGLSEQLSAHRREWLIGHLAERVQFAPGGGYQLPDAIEHSLSVLAAYAVPDSDAA